MLLPLYPIPALGPWRFGSFILPFAVLAIGAYQLLVYEGTRPASYDPIARTKLLQGLTGPLSQILFGLMGLGSAGLVYGFVIGQFSGTTYLFRRFMLPHRKNLSEHDARLACCAWRRNTKNFRSTRAGRASSAPRDPNMPC